MAREKIQKTKGIEDSVERPLQEAQRQWEEEKEEMRREISLFQARNTRLTIRTKISSKGLPTTPVETSAFVETVDAQTLQMSCTEGEEIPMTTDEIPQISDIVMGAPPPPPVEDFPSLGNSRGRRRNKGKPIGLTDEILKQPIYRPALAGVQRQLNSLSNETDRKIGKARPVRKNQNTVGKRTRQPLEDALKAKIQEILVRALPKVLRELGLPLRKQGAARDRSTSRARPKDAMGAVVRPEKVSRPDTEKSRGAITKDNPWRTAMDPNGVKVGQKESGQGKTCPKSDKSLGQHPCSQCWSSQRSSQKS